VQFFVHHHFLCDWDYFHSPLLPLLGKLFFSSFNYYPHCQKDYQNEGKKTTPTWLTFVGIAGAERSRRWNKELSANTVSFISCTSTADKSCSIDRKLLFHLLSLRSFSSSDVYRRESGRCHSLPFILKYFLLFYLSWFSFYHIQNHGQL
jgi:hypothetical protein